MLDRKTFYFILWVAAHMKLSQTKINLIAVCNLLPADMKEYLSLCSNYNSLKLDEIAATLTANEQVNFDLSCGILDFKNMNDY